MANAYLIQQNTEQQIPIFPSSSPSLVPPPPNETQNKFFSATGEWSEISGISSELLKQIMLLAHPVGSIYQSLDSTPPSQLFGGTWEQITGRFLLATGTPTANTDNYFGAVSGVQWSAGPGSLGGQDYHQLTATEMPSHQHYNSPDGQGHSFIWGPNAGTVYVDGTTAKAGQATGGNPLYTVQTQWNVTSVQGGDAVHNNMPPYLSVYVWKRTA